jgi:hypothetical protein
MAVVTTGFHRIGNVTTRAQSGVEQQVVPGAQVYVTLTSTGAAATIYSDPALSITILGSLVTADNFGSYDYYIPLNYSVTETISSANGALLTIYNVVQNGPLIGTLTTTAATTDVVSITGILSTSHVSFTPTNAAAATMIASTYVSNKAEGSITITHPATANATFDLIITPY